MTHRKLSALPLIAAVLLCGGLAQAQQSKATPENVQAVDAALREKAFELLESLASQLGSLQSAENRARLGANIAASLWNHDEKRARTLLVSVEADIKAGLHKVDEDERKDAQTRMVFLKLRMDTVERIAKHDAELALAFLKATELDPGTPRPLNVAEMERTLELQLAKQIAADKPEMALKLARRSLERGFSDDLLFLLRQLYRKDRELGLALHKEIVSKLGDVGLARNEPALYFGMRLARSLRPPTADESTYRELISLFITTALQNGCGGKSVGSNQRAYFCGVIGSLLSQIEKIDPVRATQLKHWAPAHESGFSQEGFEELADLIENGTVDEVLALAQKYPQMAGHVYWRASEKAQDAGDSERARRIVTDYIADPTARRELLARLDRAQQWNSMNAEKLAEALKTLNTFPRIQDRVRFLLALASRVGANDRKAALKLLDQASDMIDGMKPGKDQTEAQLALAMAYCLEKSDRGFAIMQSVVPMLNDLVTAAAKLDGYDSHYLREGEWNMSMNGVIGVLLTALSQQAGSFAWCDFDRAVSMAAQFERPEIRLMAQLKLAQGILAGPPKRSGVPLFLR